jgi:hypothetical protein
MYSRKINDHLVYGSLLALLVGSYISMTLTALHHILIILPIIYFFIREKWDLKFKSQWAFILMVIVIIISILFNQDIAVNGLKPIMKTKYYILGFLLYFPLQSWLNGLNTEEREKKIKWLIYALAGATTLASCYGMMRVFLNFNPLQLSYSDANRNTGFFGMVLNFAHNLALAEVFFIALLVHHRVSKKWIDTRLLIVVI